MMNEYLCKRFRVFIRAFLFSILLLLPFFNDRALADQPVLKKYIIEFNRSALEKILADDAYRGEEGILAVNPEEGESLGMKVLIDEEYLEAVKLFKEAEQCLEKAKDAMSSIVKEKSEGYYAREISENFLKYKTNSAEAKRMLSDYHARLTPENDERLNETVCSGVIDSVLEECLGGGGYGLRDKLAQFYNRCHGVNKKRYHLTDDNTRFVNYVFNGFLKESSQEEKKGHILDLDSDYNNRKSYEWKDAAEARASEYVPVLDEVIKKLGDSIYPVDPLLFLALMKKESSFKPLSVSGVGAAGLTQIMPETAKGLGMNNIFIPEYYQEAVTLLKRERSKRKSALSTLYEITEENGLELAAKARGLMQESLEAGKKRAALYKRYEKDLVENGADDRLQAALSIEYGLRYFAGLMKKFKGDISLALASYNAGETRVREYGGIPPYEETVGFRNKILQYYREYLEKTVGVNP